MDKLSQYAGEKEQRISPFDEHLQYEGRIDFDKPEGPLWSYPATSVRIRFRGKRLKILLTNFRAYWNNYLGYVLDGREFCVQIPERGASCLTLCEEEEEAVHDLLVFKRQDSCHILQIHGFLGDEGLVLLPCAPLPARCIEVYGDSVSAGEVSEAVDYCGEPDPEHNGEFSNSYHSYAWILARKLNARLHDIAQGGIALMDGIGYYMEPAQQGMESIFDKIQYQSQIFQSEDYREKVGGGPKQWDFSRFRPQLVIVAVGQNDAHPEDFCGEDYDGEKAREWRSHYAAFLRTLRRIHPQAHILCMTTILGHHPGWDRAIEEACSSLGDPRIHHFLFRQNGCGTKGHIRTPEAEGMAEELKNYLDTLGEGLWRDHERLAEVMRRAGMGEKLKLGFLGGSITQGSLASSPDTCYASRVYRWWCGAFPEAEFTYLNAGIGGTTSHFGAARVAQDLLCEKPDVVFVEFSVNDDDDAHFQETYEGLVRRLLSCPWKPAVVLLHNRFYDDGHSAQRIHDVVGAYYRVPGVYMGDAILPRIASGEFAREELTPDGLHPNDKGHELLAEVICEYLEKVRALGTEGSAVSGSEVMPLSAPMTPNRYEYAVRLRNRELTVKENRGFLADEKKQKSITEIFRHGWSASEEGAEIAFEVWAACIAVQYRKTVTKPAPVALAVLDGREEEAVILDGNFDEDWGDCLYLQTLCEEDAPRNHRVTIRIVRAEGAATPFYLVSLLLA